VPIGEPRCSESSDGDGDAEGERILREGLKVAPKSAVLHHALGLALVWLKRADAALSELEQATTLDPTNARFSYVYAVALHSMGKSDAALARLKKELTSHPNNRDVLEALASIMDDRAELARRPRSRSKISIWSPTLSLLASNVRTCYKSTLRIVFGITLVHARSHTVFLDSKKSHITA